MFQRSKSVERFLTPMPRVAAILGLVVFGIAACTAETTSDSEPANKDPESTPEEHAQEVGEKSSQEPGSSSEQGAGGNAPAGGNTPSGTNTGSNGSGGTTGGTDAGSGTTGGTTGGSNGGSNGDAGPVGSTDQVCSTAPDFPTCDSCCGLRHIKGALILGNTFTQCLCNPNGGECVNECGDTYCLEAVPTNACEKCIASAQRCPAEASAACQANTECAAYAECQGQYCANKPKG